MELSRIKLIYIILFIFTNWTYAAEKLKEIISKQELSNIRFVSNDSSFTIYQKNSGDLFLSTHYAVKKILSSEENTQFNLHREVNSPYILITKKSNYNQNFNPNQEHELFFLAYGKDKIEKLGIGITPTSHLNGEFLSFYKPSVNKIILHKKTLPTNTFDIPTNKPTNPFFRPQAIMLDPENIIFTEQNSSGIGQVIFYNLKTQTKKSIFQNKNYQFRLELCRIEKNLYVFESNYLESAETHSTFINLNLNDSNKNKVIYESNLIDIGNIICNFDKDSVLFIKNFGSKNKTNFDVAKIFLQDGKIERLTEEGHITNIFNMDGRIIVTNNGQQMLLFGENSLKKDSIPHSNDEKSDSI